MIWNSKEVKAAIHSQVPEVTFLAENPSEDFVTSQLVYGVTGATDNVYVRGFNTTGAFFLPNIDNVEVEMVEVTSEYSDGAESKQPENIMARAKIKCVLIKMGFEVVNSLDPYF